MKASKKELVFVSAIVVFSFLCSFYPRIDFKLSESINPIDKFTLLNSNNLLRSKPVRLDENDLIFRSGYCYKMGEGSNHSDFYQGNISHVNTSHYWRFPISEIDAIQYLKNKKNGYESKLFVPFDLNLPIVSIICNPDDFFSYENGIYVRGYDADFVSSATIYPSPWNQPANFYRKENDKRKVFFSYFDEKGKCGFSAYANSEISGKATRSFSQKSIRLSTSKALGNKKFDFDFFKTGNVFSSLILRNGGNDNTKSLFRDMLMQNLMRSSGLTVSHFKPCEVFLNGEYWGIHFLQNRMDRNFIAEKFNCKEKNVTIVENWALDSGKETEFKYLMENLENSDKMNYKNLSEIFDMDNLILYLVGEMFFSNTDWPSNNLKMYKISGSKNSDTKWRFAFFDLDYGFAYTGQDAVELDMFKYLLNKKDWLSKIFQILMKSEDFKNKLFQQIEKFNQSIFNSDAILLEIDFIENKLENSMVRHIDRWRNPQNFENWKEEVMILRSFAKTRPIEFLKHSKVHLR